MQKAIYIYFFYCCCRVNGNSKLNNYRQAILDSNSAYSDHIGLIRVKDIDYSSKSLVVKLSSYGNIDTGKI